MEDIKNDPRFAHIASDPLFRFMPKTKRKVRIDSRFQSIFSDQRFDHKTGVDKRGRPSLLGATKQNQHVMQRFYDLSDDDQLSKSDQETVDLEREHLKVKKKKKVEISARGNFSKKQCLEKQQDDSKSDRKTKSRKSAKEKQKDRYSNSQQSDIYEGLDKLAPEGAKCSSDDDGSQSDDELQEFTQEHFLDETAVDHKWNELQEDAPSAVESTHRLAVCNMDWDFVKAQDLFVLFRSFIPENGSIKSVTIYPSEFGKERMAEEARLGPKEMRDRLQSSSLVFSTPDKGRKKKQIEIDQQQVKRNSKELAAANTEKLREYQLNRLRYYFAVVIFDSIPTAETVYSECDGREYLLSSVRLDLRFIPDSMTFDDPPKDTFSENSNILEYEPKRFNTTALCQAKVDVTWDETDFDRLSRRLAGLQHKELESIVEENKYADIIAPPESDSDQDEADQPEWLKQVTQTDTVISEEDKIALYRRLLVDKLNDELGQDTEETVENGKEFVWQPGLKSSLTNRMQKKQMKEADEGVVNEYLEKKREKKRIKRDGKMKKKDVEVVGHTQSVDGEGESGLQIVSQAYRNHESDSLKPKKKRSFTADTVKKAGDSGQADLELLVMDGTDNMKLKNTDGAGIKKRMKKSKKKKLSEDKDDGPLDMSDTRFAALYTSHHFHIDPTATQFKKTKSMSALVDEQIKRRANYRRPQPPGAESVLPGTQECEADRPKSLSHMLVESLRSKLTK